MPFKFLEILRPTHYFSLPRRDGQYIYPKFDALPESIKEHLTLDDNYTSELSTEYDASFAAVHQGYIGEVECYSNFERVPVVDEYRFIRKQVHSAWVIYTLTYRILSLKNPITELSGFWKSRETSRVQYSKKAIIDNASIERQSIQDFPRVSVIIPTLNRYTYLKDVLEDLEKQDYPDYEVIVIDQSEPFQKDFYEGYDLDLKVEYQEEKALWLARNNAIKMSEGELVLLFDDDSRVEKDWIRQHLNCLEHFDADLSSGVSISTVGAEVPDNYNYFMVSAQLDTGNVMVKKDVFRKLGLFDRQFEKQRMGDGEYGLRAFLANFRNVSNPLAKRLHLKVGSGGLREMGSWDGFRPKKWLDPRPIPSVLYLYRKYYGNAAARRNLLKTIPPSIVPYRFKGSKGLMFVGLVVSLLILPIIMLQIMISWRRSSDKLSQGAQIENLE